MTRMRCSHTSPRSNARNGDAPGFAPHASAAAKPKQRFVLVALVALALLLIIACRDRQATQVSGAGSNGLANARLVALSPSAAELIAAVGASDELVAVDTYSTFPPQVAQLPKVGNYLAPNLEAIIALRPTLVIADDVHTATAEALRDANVATLLCPIHGLADIATALTRVGAALHRETAAGNAVMRMNAALAAARAAPLAGAPRVLAIIGRQAGGLGGLVAAGPGAWLDDLLGPIGARNALAASPVRYPKLSLEEVLRANPDVIVDLSVADADAAPVWSGVAVAAVTRHRVVTLNEPTLVAPSPRVDVALAALRRALEQ